MTVPSSMACTASCNSWALPGVGASISGQCCELPSHCCITERAPWARTGCKRGVQHHARDVFPPGCQVDGGPGAQALPVQHNVLSTHAALLRQPPEKESKALKLKKGERSVRDLLGTHAVRVGFTVHEHWPAPRKQKCDDACTMLVCFSSPDARASCRAPSAVQGNRACNTGAAKELAHVDAALSSAVLQASGRPVVLLTCRRAWPTIQGGQGRGLT